MKLVINYDFYSAIKDSNEPMGIMKMVRNNKEWVYIWVPTWMIININTSNGNLLEALAITGIEYTNLAMVSTAFEKLIGIDRYKLKADRNLKILASQLKDLNISTDYNLLLKSELYEKKTKVILNEEKFPQMIQSKYILVPTYNYNGDIKEVSIEQEHVVGSKEYVLSLGKPSRAHSFAYAYN